MITFIDESGPVTLAEGHRIVDVANGDRIVGQISHTSCRFIRSTGEYVFRGDGDGLSALDLRAVVEQMEVMQRLHPGVPK